MSDPKRVEPMFGGAPQRLPIGGTKKKPMGYMGLSKRVKVLLTLLVIGLMLGIVISVMHIPDPEEAKKAAEQKKEADDRKKGEAVGAKEEVATVPKDVTKIGGGVSTPAPVPPVSAASTPPSGGVGASTGVGEQPPSPPRTDPLAPTGAGQVPNIPGGRAGSGATQGGSQQQGRAMVDPAVAEREMELKQARDSDLKDKSGGSALPSVPGAGASGMLGGLGGQGTGAAMPPAPGQGAGAADDPNKQLEKTAFLTAAAQSAATSTYLDASVQRPQSPYQVDMGWEIHCMMDQVLDSDLPGTLRAHVAENVMDSATGRYVLIPSGSRLIGHYDSQIVFGQSRVLVVWDVIKFPDSSELRISGMPGTDQQGAAGLTGDVDNHLWPMLKAAAFLSVITAGAQLAQPQTQTSSTGSYAPPTVSQQLTAQLGQQIGQVTSNMISRYLNVQPTITTKYGTRFNILVTKNIVFQHAWSWN